MILKLELLWLWEAPLSYTFYLISIMMTDHCATEKKRREEKRKTFKSIVIRLVEV